MKTTRSLFRFVVLLLALFGGVGAVVAHAQDLGAVKSRMNERLAQIDKLKAEGAIGENLRGFLEVREGGGNSANVVSAENMDREIVYGALAKQTGATAEQVGRARARQIAAGSAPGVWLQKPDGEWYKK